MVISKLNILFRVFIGFYLRVRAFCEIWFRKDVRRKKVEYVPDLIVSMTSYGARVKRCAPYALYSILKQSIRPDKIILWLDETQWNMDNIPCIMKRLINSGVEIRFCHDVRSHTKLLPALKAYPDKPIITVDDDLYYSKKLLHELMTSYLVDKSCVYAFRGIYPTFDVNGNMLPYKKWVRTYLDQPVLASQEENLMLLGFGGVLYPPGALHEEVFNETVLLRECPYADDIWFFIMAIKKNTRRCIVSDEYITYYPVDAGYQYLHKGGLKNINVTQDNNRLQMINVIQYYGVDLKSRKK